LPTWPIQRTASIKSVVAVKRVVDYSVKVRVWLDSCGVDMANVKLSMTSFDEITLEEGVRLKERGAVAAAAQIAGGQERQPHPVPGRRIRQEHRPVSGLVGAMVSLRTSRQAAI